MSDKPKWYEYERELFNQPIEHLPNHITERRQATHDEINGIEYAEWCIQCRDWII